jgi:ribosomal protein L19
MILRTLLEEQFCMRLLNKVLKGKSGQTVDLDMRANEVVNVLFNKKYTKFNVLDYITLSKKSRRSQKYVVKVKAILQYNFCGIALKNKKHIYNPINNSFLLRNVLHLYPIEFRFPHFSPLIDNFWTSPIIRRKYLRNNAFFLRKKEVPKSKIPFEYVLY